jgi:diaminohydroxyphosphoribosylaminopyrimidine deaminase/5-amino-6-(5-phosphoribosylamino)uracil reductase
MVGAVLVKDGQIIGRGWHRRAGLPHAEIEALTQAQHHGHSLAGATLYVTLEPCCTHGRTPPCTKAIIEAGIRQVVVGAIDPNPRHRGRGLAQLRRAGLRIVQGILTQECERLNEAFNYWIVHRRPFVTVKSAMTLDGKIATPGGESKWITSERARAYGMKLRAGSDAVLVGINTILADNPNLTIRTPGRQPREFRRIVLDSSGRTPLNAKVLHGANSNSTIVVLSRRAAKKKVQQLSKRARVLVAPGRAGQIGLPWLLKKLGAENVTSLLVEGGGEVNASFLLSGLAHRVAFFYAPKVLGGANARKAVAGTGARALGEALDLVDVEWHRLGPDWLLLARVDKRTKLRPKS